MSLSFVYVIVRGVHQVIAFFRHWYIGGFRLFTQCLIGTITSLDQTFAFKITLRNLFKPLYQDYTTLGMILGIIFRPLRLFVGGVLYCIIIIFFIVAYIAWAAVPAFLITKMIIG